MAGPKQSLKDWLKTEALALGFDDCAITTAHAPDAQKQALSQFLNANHHATMAWMKETEARRADPQVLWREAKSVIMLVMNYGPDQDPLAVLNEKQNGAISVYAQNRDYHDIVKGKLKQLAGKFAARTSADVKVFVDTAPVMEKPLAARSGLGWQGKHTNLVSRDFGSWLFIGSIFTTLDIEPDAPEIDHCGSCRACLDACPTHAFPAPYQLDARRCISYLTIEHKGAIPLEFRKALGNRIYGCDDCLAVCPWNKFAQTAQEVKLQARDDLRAPQIKDLLALDDAGFRTLFSGSPIKRIGRNKFIANVLIAAGNSSDHDLVEIIKLHLADPSNIVRSSAIWALGQLLDKNAMTKLTKTFMSHEMDDDVLDEWRSLSL